jgi:hypothetical protein
LWTESKTVTSFTPSEEGASIKVAAPTKLPSVQLLILALALGTFCADTDRLPIRLVATNATNQAALLTALMLFLPSEMGELLVT